MNEQETVLQRITEEFFQKLGAPADVQIALLEEGTYAIDVAAKEAQPFIGEGGKILFELQYLLRSILQKRLGERVRIVLDINGYRKNKESYLKELARTTADEAALLKKERELPPMSSFERKVVHTELSARTDVETESRGEEPNRCVVIRPRSASEGP